MTRFIVRSILRAGKLIGNPLSMSGSYHIPMRRDARNDFAGVIGDMRKLGQNLRSVTQKELNDHGR